MANPIMLSLALEAIEQRQYRKMPLIITPPDSPVQTIGDVAAAMRAAKAMGEAASLYQTLLGFSRRTWKTPRGPTSLGMPQSPEEAVLAILAGALEFLDGDDRYRWADWLDGVRAKNLILGM